jgi:hypothetical protein
MDTIKPHIREEVANVWRLWKAGVVRLPLEFILDPRVDVGEPFDRTKLRTQGD